VYAQDFHAQTTSDPIYPPALIATHDFDGGDLRAPNMGALFRDCGWCPLRLEITITPIRLGPLPLLRPPCLTEPSATIPTELECVVVSHFMGLFPHMVRASPRDPHPPPRACTSGTSSFTIPPATIDFSPLGRSIRAKGYEQSAPKIFCPRICTTAPIVLAVTIYGASPPPR